MAQAPEAPTFTIEDGRIFFRNFAGKEGPMNAAGERNFACELTPDVAAQMEKDGWNVKYTKVREDGDIPTPYIPVKVSYANFPPRIVMVSSNARTQLTEDSVEVLDWTNIQKVDLICRGYSWSVNGKSGLKAYVKTMFVIIDEDELERKYAINEVGV